MIGKKIHIASTPIDTPWRVVFRFVTGRDLNGGYKTDHKWTKPGTCITSHDGRASRWAHQPMRRRAGVRFLGLFTLICLLIGPLISIASTVQTLRVLAWLTLLAGGWVIYERSRKWAQRRLELHPLAEAIAHHLKDSRYIHNPREWIELPVDVMDGTTVIYLPVDHVMSETAERSFATMVGRRVGLGRHPSAVYELQGERPRLELRPAPAPRDLVAFTDPDVRALVESADEGRLLLGLGPRDVPAWLDLNVQAPHIGMSMSTNAGKSTTARGLLMQHLHEGGVALILDPKMDSHLWARDLPNVRYADTPQEIHEALMWLWVELDQRCEMTKEHADIRGDVDPALVGPRLMLVGEELNTLEIDVKTYWRSIRDPKTEPILPPSLAALGRALNMGRARRINAFMIAQELLVQSLGGPAAKTNLSTRILGRANTPTWNKLAPECKVSGRYPRKSMHRGRVYLVTGDEPMPVQTMFCDEQTAIDYSLSGVVSHFPGEGGRGSDRVRNSRENDPQFGHSTDLPRTNLPHAFLDAAEDDDHLDEPDGTLGTDGVMSDVLFDPDAELVTLADAAERLALSLKTLQNARDRRSPGFPEPDPDTVRPGKASLYLFVDLEKWSIDRTVRRA